MSLDMEDSYIKKIDELIRTGNTHAYDKIRELFIGTAGMPIDKIISLGKIPLKIFKARVNEMHYLLQALKIYGRERDAGVDVTVFDHGNNLQDIIDVMNQIRFIFWESLFLGINTDYILKTYVDSNNISREMLLFLSNTANLPNYEEGFVKEEHHLLDENSKHHAGKSVAFILCVNNETYMNEALYFISCLKVPCGCDVNVFTINEAHSMTAGYNEGMKASDAKYKVYLHQDVFIVNPYFIYEILDLFDNPDIGMIGMVGTPRLPEDKVMIFSKRIGKIYGADPYSTSISEFEKVEGKYQSVEAVDGLLIATQYDIPWREDLFDKWDMYDLSQSLEFHRAGYDVVVPDMDFPWCLHDDGFLNLVNYYDELEKAKQEYYSI
ncbi:MAG: glycosyltransferase family protein [Clostridium sp.]|nr:glycosyltransferase family protein [Clostridium sp.]